MRSSLEIRYCLIEGAGRLAGNDGASGQQGESGGTGKALRRFGGRNVLNLKVRKPSGESVHGREALFFCDRWTIRSRLSVYAVIEAGWNSPRRKPAVQPRPRLSRAKARRQGIAGELIRESGNEFDPKEANGDSGAMGRIRKRSGDNIASAMSDTGPQSGRLDWDQGCSCRFRFAPEPQSEDPQGS